MDHQHAHLSRNSIEPHDGTINHVKSTDENDEKIADLVQGGKEEIFTNETSIESLGNKNDGNGENYIGGENLITHKPVIPSSLHSIVNELTAKCNHSYKQHLPTEKNAILLDIYALFEEGLRIIDLEIEHNNRDSKRTRVDAKMTTTAGEGTHYHHYHRIAGQKRPILTFDRDNDEKDLHQHKLAKH